MVRCRQCKYSNTSTRALRCQGPKLALFLVMFLKTWSFGNSINITPHSFKDLISETHLWKFELAYLGQGLRPYDLVTYDSYVTQVSKILFQLL